MKGNAKVLDELNQALREELTAINQYFLHAEICENWGYDKLANYIKKQSIGEMKHAESLMERILFLDGIPDMKPLSLSIGKDVKEMLKADLDLEVKAVAMYNA
ncbi:MAG TPA: bacterioferritin, partial [Acidobacteriaceae bacterium]|nr:bacterioferritin [Acidobacteriaceae bacterium]